MATRSLRDDPFIVKLVELLQDAAEQVDATRTAMEEARLMHELRGKQLALLEEYTARLEKLHEPPEATP